MRRDVVRVGVLGVGAMGASHIDTLHRWVPSVEIAAIFAPHRERVEPIAHRVGAMIVDSAHDVIHSDQVDAVLIATPDDLHEELALACVAAGKPAFCEKPQSTARDGARRVVDAELACGRRLIQVGFMRRFDPAYVTLRHAVLGGAVGTVKLLHGVHRNPHAQPYATSEGIPLNSMIHDFDSTAWLLDDALTAVTMFSPRDDESGLQDVQVSVVETAGGKLAIIEMSVNARYGYDIHTEVTGTDGTVSLTPPYGLSYRQANRDGRTVASDFVSRFVDAYRIELAAWIDGCEVAVSSAKRVGRTLRQCRGVRGHRIAPKREHDSDRCRAAPTVVSECASHADMLGGILKSVDTSRLMSRHRSRATRLASRAHRD